MENKDANIKETYARHLKAVDYVDVLSECYDQDIAALRKHLAFFYDIVRSGRFKGSKLLDLGSGAVVHNVASASAFYPNIIMSDYVEDNCQELKRWLNGQSELKQFLRVAAELEGYKEDPEAGQQQLENRIRQCVKQVVRCDVTSDGIFLEDLKPEVAPPYDLIISSLCLETAAKDAEDFARILKRIGKLLRPEGGLVLVGYFGGRQWKMKDVVYHYLNISEEELRKALSESGFGNVDLRVLGKFDTDLRLPKYGLAAEKL